MIVGGWYVHRYLPLFAFFLMFFDFFNCFCPFHVYVFLKSGIDELE